MTKEETIAKLRAAAGDSNYGKAVVDEFEAHFDDDAKKIWSNFSRSYR